MFVSGMDIRPGQSAACKIDRQFHISVRLACTIVLTVVLLALQGCRSGDAEEQESETTATPVSVTTVSIDTVVETERSMARSEAADNPRVSTEVGGRVEEILHDIGDRVEAGTVLARLDKTPYQLELSAAQANAAALSARLDRFQSELDRLERVGEGQYVSESDLEEAQAEVTATREELAAAESRRESAERDLDRALVRAPIDGQIDERLISEGDYLSTGDGAFQMIPDASARVSLPFPERVGDRLEVGMPVQLRRLDRDEDWIDGRLTRLRPSVEGGMGAVAVVEFDPPEQWRSGTMLEGLVEVDRREDALLVPSESVLDRPAGKVIYVVVDSDSDEYAEVEQRMVELGYRTAERTEILDGLDADDSIVVEGAAFLSDGAAVRIRERD
jgi:RND family efflux transporter MFP subunit